MLLDKECIPDLVAIARKVTLKYKGDGVFIRSIISAKTGACPEDCAFCSQSAHFDTHIRSHPMLAPETILEAAKESEKNGAADFCIVTSGRGPDSYTLRKVLEAVDLILRYTTLKVGCSLGSLTEKQAWALKEAGVHRYNHNLEAARSYFPQICSTHTYEDRVGTALLVKKVGMQLCCGGILGMGETLRQRLELAFEIRELDPTWVPINLLNPRPGTPLGNFPKLAPFEAVKTIAVFRLILPDKILMSAGGREVVLRDLQSMGILAGANALIMGNYLTTLGRLPEEDLAMLKDLEMPVRKDV